MPATKNTPSTHHPRRRNVTTLMVGLKKNGHIRKNLTQSGEPQRYSWGTQKKNQPQNKQKQKTKKLRQKSVNKQLASIRNAVLALLSIFSFVICLSFVIYLSFVHSFPACSFMPSLPTPSELCELFLALLDLC